MVAQVAQVVMVQMQVAVAVLAVQEVLVQTEVVPQQVEQVQQFLELFMQAEAEVSPRITQVQEEAVSVEHRVKMELQTEAVAVEEPRIPIIRVAQVAVVAMEQ
jgi:hypothetical protein